MKSMNLAAAGLAALAIGGAGVAAVTGASAQGSKPAVILMVDRAALVSQSAAGKTIPTQANSIKTAIEKELQAEADKLKKDIENYQKNGNLMSEEVRAKTEKELAARQQVVLPQQAQIMEQAFSLAVQNAEAQVLNESRPILKTIVDKRGATLLVDRAVVMYGAPETDITAEVIAELDKKLKNVTVEKITLAQVMQKLKDAQNQQAQKSDGKKK
jgi:outer membrane protein